MYSTGTKLKLFGLRFAARDTSSFDRQLFGRYLTIGSCKNSDFCVNVNIAPLGCSTSLTCIGALIANFASSSVLVP